MSKSQHALQSAYFGGGCFWCTEAIFSRLRGVHSVTSGYAGGRHPEPTYAQVSTGMTGHAEVVRVEFDPAVISYADLLAVFWATHNPTTPDQQGADKGPQYRSIILTNSEHQLAEAKKSRQQIEASGQYDAPVVTEIVPLQDFYTAEEYHQNYYERQPEAQYCSFVIRPKLEKLEKTFAHLLR